MLNRMEIRIILVGLGFMGGMHAQSYALIPGARIVAIVDFDLARARQQAAKLHLAVPTHATLAEALRSVPADMVDICLPTDLHPAAALEAIAAGKAVFCEKPLALTVKDADEIAAAATLKGVSLQVGQCIRFWPEYQALVEFVRADRAGRLLSLNLTRRSGRPTASAGNWLMDPKRSLGALLDLHIHDTDFVHHLLGNPHFVTTFGTKEATGWSHVFTHYHFDGIAVHAEGGWNYPGGWGFQMAFQAVFENGAVEYDSNATPTLRATIGDHPPAPLPFLAPKAGSSIGGAGNISSLGGYYNELAYFIACLRRGEMPRIATGDQAARSVRTVLAELESAETGRTIAL